MEVHHHPHVEKKNFKEYFLEFLMIFLAVTMGFFAESLREHMADRSKEKEFMISLKEDVVSDTTQLSRLLPFRDVMFEKLDSLHSLLQAASEGKPYDIHTLYHLNFTYAFGFMILPPNNRTLSQIKNVGAFSLITNKTCRDTITAYDNSNENFIKGDLALWFQKQDDLNTMSQKIFSYDLVKRFALGPDRYEFFLNDSLPLKLLNDDKLLLTEYANKVRALEMIYDVLILMEKAQFDRSKNLIALLNKEYHLDK